jgi:hypothetical protein
MRVAQKRHRIFIGLGGRSCGYLDLRRIAVRSAAQSGFRRDLRHRRNSPGPPQSDSPGLDLAYEIAEVVMDVLGPFFWATLVLAFAVGPLGIAPFR